jgi:hypothetical protein
MRCLVTYDVNKPHHAAVKARCIVAGFHDYIEMPDGSHRQLPNTTLAVRADNAEDAVNKFKEQISLLSDGSLMPLPIVPIIIEKVVGVEYTKFFAENNNSIGNILENYSQRKD